MDLSTTGHADAAADYAQQIPVRVIAHILGCPQRHVRLVHRAGSATSSNSGMIRSGGGAARSNFSTISSPSSSSADKNPGDDLLSELLHTEVEGAPRGQHRARIAALVLIAGCRHDLECDRLLLVAPGDASR
jgi:cytochrome P450